MLVLTRRSGESIVIGDEVRVVVLEVRGDTVRLGIEAPRSVQVHRAEVYAEVQAANAAAASGLDDLDLAAARLQQLARPRPPRQRTGHARLDRGSGSPEQRRSPPDHGSDGPPPAAPAVPAPVVPAPVVPPPVVPRSPWPGPPRPGPPSR